MPTSTGYEVRENATYDWDGRKRGQTPFTVLQHTISGAGNLRYEHRELRVKEGETLLVLVPHNHRYWLEDGDRWNFLWISMNGEEALRIHRSILAVTGPILKERDDEYPRRLQPAPDIGRRNAGTGIIDRLRGGHGAHDDVFGSHPVFSEEYRTMQHDRLHHRQSGKAAAGGGPRKGGRPQPRAFLAHVRRQRRTARPPNTCCRSG